MQSPICRFSCLSFSSDITISVTFFFSVSLNLKIDTSLFCRHVLRFLYPEKKSDKFELGFLLDAPELELIMKNLQVALIEPYTHSVEPFSLTFEKIYF